MLYPYTNFSVVFASPNISSADRFLQKAALELNIEENASDTKVSVGVYLFHERTFILGPLDI